MVAEKVRQRAGFQAGRWVQMGDHQRWMFPPPPAPGVDRDYDALLRIHHEAEDENEERKTELAMAMLLLSRNYDPTPDEYENIFTFGLDGSARSTAHAAISEAVRFDLEDQPVNRLPAQLRSAPPHFHTHFHGIQTSLRTRVDRLHSTLAPWLPRAGGREQGD